MKNYSIVKFGSQLNNGFDKYSDKDLLVVTDSSASLRILHRKYSDEGWSVSCYTYSKLKYLSSNGSLFINHLKNDSLIISDYNNNFKSILNDHVQKADYSDDILGAKHYFTIIQKIPDNVLGYAWFCDCFYVGLRNYLIFRNANLSVFEFSYLRLIEKLEIENTLSMDECTVLRELRVLKFNYREDILDELPARSFVEKVIGIGKRLGLVSFVDLIAPNVFQNNIVSRLKSPCLNGYQRLRLIEGLYCANEQNIPEIKKIVSNPQFYSSKLLNDDFVTSLIERMNVNSSNSIISLLFQTKITE